MSERKVKDAAASIRQRLLNLREQLGDNFQLILNRYARERLLYRIGISPHRERFVLKGAMLFTIWFDEQHRLTRDIDLLGVTAGNIPEIVQLFREITSASFGDDGLRFPPEEIVAAEIREDQVYGGVRVKIIACLGQTRIPLQVDIGFGDAVTPEPVEVTLPSILDLPQPTLMSYTPETVIAEKLHAIVILGMANSRMKYYFDLWLLLGSRENDKQLLSRAVSRTFERRKTALPGTTPIGLTEEFSEDTVKRVQWEAFVSRTNLASDAPDLTTAIAVIRSVILPCLDILQDSSPNQ